MSFAFPFFLSAARAITSQQQPFPFSWHLFLHCTAMKQNPLPTFFCFFHTLSWYSLSAFFHHFCQVTFYDTSACEGGERERERESKQRQMERTPSSCLTCPAVLALGTPPPGVPAGILSGVPLLWKTPADVWDRAFKGRAGMPCDVPRTEHRGRFSRYVGISKQTVFQGFGLKQMTHPLCCG